MAYLHELLLQLRLVQVLSKFAALFGVCLVRGELNLVLTFGTIFSIHVLLQLVGRDWEMDLPDEYLLEYANSRESFMFIDNAFLLFVVWRMIALLNQRQRSDYVERLLILCTVAVFWMNSTFTREFNARYQLNDQ